MEVNRSLSHEERDEVVVTAAGDDDDEVKEPVEPEPWVRIQRTTFTNWINVKLRERPGMEVRDLQSDFQDGVLLCRLMEVLTGRPLPGKVVVKAHLNAYEVGGNLGLALDAMKHDGIRLVNIGPEDISGGNLKLILGLVWLLIRHYQIGMSGSGHTTQLPSKAMMLSWINAALRPHLTVTNFTRDWNDGRALLGLIEFCRAGSCNAYDLDSDDDNRTRCDRALKLAEKTLRVPLVLSGEHLASPELDEQSTMTYLSYFMAVNSPGYKATLRWVQRQIAPVHVLNFYSSWNSGDVALALVNSFLDEPIDAAELPTAEEKCRRAVEASEQQLGVPHVIRGQDLASPDVDYLSIMAYAAWHRPEYQQPPMASLDSTENLLDFDDIVAESTTETLAPVGHDTDLACETDTHRDDLCQGAEDADAGETGEECEVGDRNSADVKDEDNDNNKTGDDDITAGDSGDAGYVHVEEEVEEEVVASKPVLHTEAEKPAPVLEPEHHAASERIEAAYAPQTAACTKQPPKDEDAMQRYMPLLILLLAIIILHLINKFVNHE